MQVDGKVLKFITFRYMNGTKHEKKTRKMDSSVGPVHIGRSVSHAISQVSIKLDSQVSAKMDGKVLKFFTCRYKRCQTRQKDERKKKLGRTSPHREIRFYCNSICFGENGRQSIQIPEGSAKNRRQSNEIPQVSL